LPGYGGTPRYVEALDELVVALMIEKASAVENLDEILAVGGIDMIQWGPSDYAMSIGRAGEQDSKVVRDAERRVLSACLEAGIPARAEIRSPEEASYYLDLGVRHFNLGIDLFTLYDVLKQGGEQLREIVGTA
jgi:2-keto-3-deoxy-L-rhamnonate aldolase RhmA